MKEQLYCSIKLKYEQVQIRTTLQAQQQYLHIGKLYTICSLYLPQAVITRQEIEISIRQLRRQFYPRGLQRKEPDVGGGGTRSENRGNLIEDKILNLNPSVVNNRSPTFYHIQHNSHSVMELSIWSPDCFLDFHYRVLSELRL